MHITILALGSRGDVQPYVALGSGLQRAGHQIRLATFENFRPIVTEQGLDFHPVPGDAQQLMASQGGLGLSEAGQNPLKMIRSIRETFGAVIDHYIDGFSALASLKTDLILDQIPAALFGYDLAQALQVPHLVVAVIPLIPTREFPLSLLGTRSLGSPLNRLSYSVGWHVVWQSFRAGVNRFRRKLDLPPESFLGRARQSRQRRDPVIQGFSKHVVAVPPDWGAHVHTTGYWLLDEPDWQPSSDLMEFLSAGSPPVFIGFGSMPLRDPVGTFHQVVAALQMSGQRGVISRGWSGVDTITLPDTIFQTDYVPYSWLFPRMAAIVHHGGSGTTGLSLRSGVPTIIVPFLADQPYWGKRVAALNAGTAPIPFRELTVNRLAAAITTAVNDADMRRSAAELGARLRSEDGIGTAVNIIERYGA
jgi:sterol 3beta-glucosyltransferase